MTKDYTQEEIDKIVKSFRIVDEAKDELYEKAYRKAKLELINGGFWDIEPSWR